MNSTYPYSSYYTYLPGTSTLPDEPSQLWPSTGSLKRPAEGIGGAGSSKRSRTESQVDEDAAERASLPKQVATDVWRFVRPLQSRERPNEIPPDGPNIYSKPDTPFIGCKLCTQWKVWKCIVGMTTTIRNHLRNEHGEEYERICQAENLKHAVLHPPSAFTGTPAPSSSPRLPEPPRKGSASDVWRFLRPLEARDKPVDWNPPADEPILSRKPEVPFIGCKLCVSQWRVWKCIDGMTSTIRVHLQKEHHDVYERIVKAENLKQLPLSGKNFRSSRMKSHSRVQPDLPSDTTRWATNTVATDVWYFMRPLDSRDQPPNWKEPDDEPILDKKPTSPFLGCKLCSKRNQWRVWKCINGMSSTIRRHLQMEHGEVYASVCKAIGLKAPVEGTDDTENDEECVSDMVQVIDPAITAISAPSQSSSAVAAKDKTLARVRQRDNSNAFSFEVFYDKLVHFIISAEQPLDVVESPAFRDMMLFTRRSINEGDLPDRQKMISLIESKFNVERKSLIEEIQNTPGLVSFSVQLTTQPKSRLVATAHYCTTDTAGALSVRSRLIAFHHIPGAVRGRCDSVDAHLLARKFYEVLDAFGLREKIGAITLGEVLFQNNMVEELEKMFSAAGIHGTEYMRSFLPVIDDSVEAGLRVLTHLPSSSADAGSGNLSFPVDHSQSLLDNKDYLEAFEGDPVSRARDIVEMFRHSDAWDLVVQNALEAGQDAGNELVDTAPGVPLMDDGRWSATYLMIDRILALYPVIEAYLKDPKHASAARYALSSMELNVLNDVKEFLRCPYTVHDIVGEEKMPLAIMAIPLYERLLVVLRYFRETIPEIGHGVSLTIIKLEHHFIYARKGRFCALSIILNPTAKLKWMDDNWSTEERDRAKEHILEAMLVHLKKLRPVKQSADVNPVMLKYPRVKEAVKGLPNLTRIFGLTPQRRSNHSWSSIAGQSSLLPGSMDNAETPEHPDEDRAFVEYELQKYIAAGPLETSEELGDFNIMQYWKEHAKSFPLLYLVAQDILPVQASVYPSRTPFQSSQPVRDEDTLESIDIQEMTTILKHVYDPHRLDFTWDWIAREKELRIQS